MWAADGITDKMPKVFAKFLARGNPSCPMCKNSKKNIDRVWPIFPIMVYDTAKSGTYPSDHMGVQILWTEILEAPGLVVLGWMERVRLHVNLYQKNFKFKIMKVLLGDHDRLSDWDSMSDADVNQKWEWVGSDVQESLNIFRSHGKNGHKCEHDIKWVTTGERNMPMPEVSNGDSEKPKDETNKYAPLTPNPTGIPGMHPPTAQAQESESKAQPMKPPPKAQPPNFVVSSNHKFREPAARPPTPEPAARPPTLFHKRMSMAHQKPPNI